MPSPINYFYIRELIKPYIGSLLAYKRKFWLKGQLWLEYAVIMVLIITALVGMQVYLQRQLQGRYRDATNYALKSIISAKGSSNLPLQYEPYYDESETIKTSGSQIRESYSPGGISSTEIVRDATLGQGIEREFPYSDAAEK